MAVDGQVVILPMMYLALALMITVSSTAGNRLAFWYMLNHYWKTHSVVIGYLI